MRTALDGRVYRATFLGFRPPCTVEKHVRWEGAPHPPCWTIEEETRRPMLPVEGPHRAPSGGSWFWLTMMVLGVGLILWGVFGP